MKSHAKATSAGSTRRLATAVSVLLATAALLALAAAPTYAAQGHPFLETFGSADQPSFGNPAGMAVDQSTGDLLVIDTENQTLSRYHEDGTPSDFSALSATNVIDGQVGEADETPSGGLALGVSGEVQVAVDTSGGATDGNIYLTAAPLDAIYVFGSNGSFLGQLTEYKQGPLAEGPLTEFSEPCGVAVDPDGNVYVGNYPETVQKFEPTGSFPVGGDNTLNIVANNPCTVAAGAGPTAGFVFVDSYFGSITKYDDSTGEEKYAIPGEHTTVSVDPVGGNVYAATGSEVAEYDASGAESATTVSAIKPGSFVQSVAANGTSGNVYVAREGNNANIDVYGPLVTVPGVTIESASDVTGAKATLNGTVNPDGVEITECKFEYGTTTAYGSSKPCQGAIPTDSADHAVSAALGGLLANGATYHYRIVAENADGQQAVSDDETLVTANTFRTDPASALSDTKATLNGTVRLEGVALTDCKFEYGATASYGSSVPCSPHFSTIPNNSFDNAVSGAVTGLAPNGTYHFRLVATNAVGTILGADRTFTTIGPPQIVDQRPLDATRTSVRLQARINPSDLPTTYHFEFGTDTSYGTRIPADHELFIGSGADPLTVSATRSGLQESSVYFFRVVATNSEGTTVGPDQRLETLNEHDLPDNRAFELVSPSDKRPTGAVRSVLDDTYQIAEDGDSALYPMINGLADTDSGGNTTYMAVRSPTGWHSTKVSPPSLEPAPLNGLVAYGQPGFVLEHAPDLSCGIVFTFNPLTDDTPVADVKLGIYNLYVRYSDGTYRLITSTVPSNPELRPIYTAGNPVTRVLGVSPDCGKVYFRSAYDYLPNATGLYEWDDGTIREAATLPPGLPDGAVASGNIGQGEVEPVLGGSVGAGGSAGANRGTEKNAVSADGSRFFFTAPSNDAATLGKPAVFVREDGGNTVVEASRKQGGVAESLGARYEVASPDGSHVFFLANYGLTPDSSDGPIESCAEEQAGTDIACDLYDYEVETGELTNLSANTDPANTKGAVAQGVIAVSDDGEAVYFAARGRLVPGEGKTYAENTAGPFSTQSANVYLSREGEISYVTTIAARDLRVSADGQILIRGQGAAEATPDADRLLFASQAKLTIDATPGIDEVYLYSAETDTLECVSCRADGEPATVKASLDAMTADGRRAFFTKEEVLAPGAIDGNINVYEWAQGQVVLLATGKPALGFLAVPQIKFVGVDSERSGDDVFISTTEQLSPHDTDLVSDLYDLRVDGGFAPPDPPPIPCNPAADECQGTPSAQPGAPSIAGAGFSGPGNPPESKPLSGKACPKGKVRRRGKCVKRRKRGARQAKRSHNRAANHNRGGAK